MGTQPPNFSWCEDGRLAACAFPDQIEHLDYLTDGNVGCIVSLTAEREVDSKDTDESVLQIVYLPVRDYTPPTLEQVNEFIQTVHVYNAKDKAVCVHCAHGLGRTGTMLACYYVKVQQLSAHEAIRHVRQLRPGSIETVDQEEFVHTFQEQLVTKDN